MNKRNPDRNPDRNPSSSGWRPTQPASIPRKLVILVAVPAVIALFAHFAGWFYAVLFGLVIVIPAARALLRGESVTDAVLSGDAQDFSGKFAVQGGLLHYSDGKETWYENISAYRGVLWREQVVRSPGSIGRRHLGRMEHNTTYQILELVHATKPERTVRLFESTDDSGVLARWEEAALTYNLPALRDLGDGEIVRRDPRDLGKSVRKLVHEGLVPDDFDVREKAPRGVSWRRHGATLFISVRKSRWPHLLVVLPLALIAYLIPTEPLFFKLAILCLPLAAVLWMWVDYRIRLTRDRLFVARAIGIFVLPGRSLPVDDIEYVFARSSFPVSSVEISTHRRTLTLGFLADDTAAWLQRFLVSCIANAPAVS